MFSRIGCGCLKSRSYIKGGNFLARVISRPGLIAKSSIHLKVKCSIKDFTTNFGYIKWNDQVKYISTSISVISQKKSSTTTKFKDEKVLKLTYFKLIIFSFFLLS